MTIDDSWSYKIFRTNCARQLDIFLYARILIYFY